MECPCCEYKTGNYTYFNDFGKCRTGTHDAYLGDFTKLLVAGFEMHICPKCGVCFTTQFKRRAIL